MVLAEAPATTDPSTAALTALVATLIQRILTLETTVRDLDEWIGAVGSDLTEYMDEDGHDD